MYLGDRVIDVGSEWRTFSNDKATKDPSRVGDTQNPLLSDGDLTTMIGKVIINRKICEHFSALQTVYSNQKVLKKP